MLDFLMLEKDGENLSQSLCEKDNMTTITNDVSIKIDRVVAIDPGKTTGLAWMRQENGTIILEQTAEASPEEVIELLRPTSADWKPSSVGQPPLRVVMEKFIVNAMTSKRSQEATWALETIGAVKQALRDAEYPLPAIAWQSPADAKNAFSNEKLKNLGLWHRGGEGHANDAIRHGGLYLAKIGFARVENIKT